MNERERWIVYPLIFFLLLLVTRDNILKTQEVKCNRLVCNKVFVQTEDGRELVRIFGSYDRGIISFYGPVDDSIDDERWTESSNANQNITPMVQIGVQNGGGFANFYGRPDTPTVMLGHHQSLAASGLMATGKSKRPLPSDAATSEGIWGTTVLWDQPVTESDGDDEAPGSTADDTSTEDAISKEATTGTKVEDSAESTSDGATKAVSPTDSGT